MYGLNLVLFGLMFGLVMLPEVQPSAWDTWCERLVLLSSHHLYPPLCLDSYGTALWLYSQENCASGGAGHSHGLCCALWLWGETLSFSYHYCNCTQKSPHGPGWEISSYQQWLRSFFCLYYHLAALCQPNVMCLGISAVIVCILALAVSLRYHYTLVQLAGGFKLCLVLLLFSRI